MPSHASPSRDSDPTSSCGNGIAGGGSLTEIDPSTSTVINTVPAGSHPNGFAFDGSQDWVADLGGNDVTEIYAATGNIVATILVGSRPQNVMAFDGNHVWVSNDGDNTVSEIDVA